jgi:hypothetical protein
MQELPKRYQVIRSAPYLGNDMRSNSYVTTTDDLEEAKRIAEENLKEDSYRVYYLVVDRVTNEEWKFKHV